MAIDSAMTTEPIAAALRRPAAAPRRRCLATREERDKATLLRFVVGPGDELVPDIEGRLPGRGLWLTPRRDIVAAAGAKNLFAKAARRRVVVSPDLAERVEALLLRRCLDLLGLARGAGVAVAGFEKVRAWLLARRAGVLLAAGDGALDGRRKLRAAAHGLPVIELFSGAELGAALGRETVIHAALAPGRIADRLLAESARLAEMRGPREPQSE